MKLKEWSFLLFECVFFFFICDERKETQLYEALEQKTLLFIVSVYFFIWQF